MKRPDGLTKERLGALIRFIDAHPSDWKVKLNNHFQLPSSVWVPEADQPLLRQLRNEVRPTYWTTVTAGVLQEWGAEDAARQKAYDRYHTEGPDHAIHVEGAHGGEPMVAFCGDEAWVQAWVLVKLDKEVGHA